MSEDVIAIDQSTNEALIGINELSTLLDICKTTIYSRMVNKDHKSEIKNINSNIRENFKKIYYEKDKNSFKVDINEILHNHKLFNFNFKSENFLDRVSKEKTIKITDLPSYIKTTDVEYFFDLTRVKLNTLRKNYKIKYKIIEDERYVNNSKNHQRYLYEKLSLLDYAIKENIFIKSRKVNTHEFKKEFFSPNECVDYLKEKYNFKTSVMTIHRRIDQEKIPAIRIYDLKKIPILEFENLNHVDIFNMK